MDKNFEKGLKFVLAREGGYSNHPSDSGGEQIKELRIKLMMLIAKVRDYQLKASKT